MKATVHELIFGADWACFRGDTEGLSDLVRQLAEAMPELRRELIAIDRLANIAEGNPIAAWAALRRAIADDLADDADPDPAEQRC